VTSTKRPQSDEDEERAEHDVTHQDGGITIPPQIEEFVCSAEETDERKDERDARTNCDKKSEHDRANRDDQWPCRAVTHAIKDSVEKIDCASRPLRVGQRLERHESRLTLLERDTSEQRLVWIT